ncbi:hypothetical protein MVEN_00687400 [Mycena venus]|uniref:Uncharacterized protein n=1 Tax=Mycena venus TaxID=2733690 RepID=A0A8H7D303_9AGAR|nr:hypothetical protein MVEN_00687400 [Mycena venus]
MAIQQYPLDKTFLVAAWLEAILYGIYFCLFWFSVYISIRGRRMKSQNSIMFFTSIAMFIIATMHIALNGYRAITGYVDFASTPGGPVAFVGLISSWHHITKDVLYTCQSILGDAMAVYRCWILWNRDYKFVLLPFCLLLMSAVSGSMVTILFATSDPNASIFDSRLTDWITVFTSIAVAQNVLTTGLMAFRLWNTERNSSQIRVGRGVFLPILRILVESAALYLFVEILMLTFYQANYNPQYIVLETITPVVGITFVLITIRIVLRSQQSSQESEVHDLHATVGSMPIRRRIAVNITTRMDDGADGKMSPV